MLPCSEKPTPDEGEQVLAVKMGVTTTAHPEAGTSHTAEAVSSTQGVFTAVALHNEDTLIWGCTRYLTVVSVSPPYLALKTPPVNRNRQQYQHNVQL